MSGFSDLAMSLHLRNNPRSIRKFTTRTLSERQGKRSSSTKQVNVLLDAWKHLPEEERKAYSRIAVLHEQNRDRSEGMEGPVNRSRAVEAAHPTVSSENARPPLPPNRTVSKSRRRPALPESSSSSAYVSDEPNRTIRKQYVGEMSEVHFLHPLLPQEGNKLFIGDIRAANDLARIQQHKIQAILTLGKANSPANFPFVKHGYQTIPLEDKDSANIIGKLHAISQFLALKLEHGNVLIHCYFGVSRSCAAVIGFLMKRFKLTLADARKLVHTARPCMDLSPWFEQQLRQYESVFALG